MSKKSDKRRETRISATDASRSFSRLLDEVENGGRFLVHRHGRDVCMIASPLVQGRRASECLDLLRARSPVPLDDGFGDDLLEVIAGEPAAERPAWAS